MQLLRSQISKSNETISHKVQCPIKSQCTLVVLNGDFYSFQNTNETLQMGIMQIRQPLPQSRKVAFFPFPKPDLDANVSIDAGVDTDTSSSCG